MKLISSALASSVLAVVLMGGCAMNPHHEGANAPSIKVTAESKNISAGTSTRVWVSTMNVVGGSDVKWTVTPDVAKVTPDGDHSTTTALFSSQQQGTYTVMATIDLSNGQRISNSTNITVNGVK